MIRVLQIVTRLVIRGVPRHVLDLAAGLDPSAFRVDVVAGRGETGEGSLWAEAAARGIHAIRAPSLRRPVRPGADLRALAEIYRVVRRGRYDIVHTHISKAGVLGRLAARLAGVPVVIHTYHGAVEEVARPGATGTLFRWVERSMARCSDRLLAVSADTARSCLAMGIGRDDQYRVIHNGIDLQRFANWRGAPPFALPSGATVVGVVGSLTAEKRVDVLIEAVEQLRVRIPDLHLFIVGDGPLRGTLNRLVAQRGLEGCTHLVGLVEDVRPWLAHFDVLVAPSGSEGLPTVLLEALAMGCPIIASRVGGIPEIVQDGYNGALVTPGDPVALASALARLLGDDRQRMDMGRNGRSTATAKFGLESMLRLTEDLYRELLAEKGVLP